MSGVTKTSICGSGMDGSSTYSGWKTTRDTCGKFTPSGGPGMCGGGGMCG